MASIDYGPWNPTIPERVHVEDVAARFPHGWRIRCGSPTRRGTFQATVTDSTGQEIAIGSFEAGDFAMVRAFLRATARQTQSALD